MQCEKHKTTARSHKQTPAISQFCISAPGPALTTVPAATSTDLRAAFGATPTLKSEVLWILNTVVKHQSYNSNEGIGELFRSMFPDSQIASTFASGKDKTAYITCFGLAPFIKNELICSVNKSFFVLMFDETLNHATKNKQPDVHIRYCVGDQVHSCYLGSQFMGNATAQDLLHHFKECVDKLDLRNMVSISMDGPNVNWKFFELLQQEHAEQYGVQLVVVGSCGLHSLHNAFKCGFSMWQLEKVLRAMHFLFHDTPARRDDFIALTKSSVFPLPFCGHQWIENLPVVERAIESMLWRFVKREHLHNITPLQLVRLDVADQKIWVNLKEADIGLGAEVALKDLQRKNIIGELTDLEFRKDCVKGMSNILKKVQDKSPLKYPIVRQVACLDPTVMYSNPDWCQGRMRSLVQKFLQDKQLSGGVSAGDVIIQQFGNFLSVEAKSEHFLSFRSIETRLDVFLHGFLSQPYPELWGFCQKLLLLSHGRATVERGFSINKEVETVNLQEDTVIAQRLVCDYVAVCGGVANVPLTKELLTSVGSARSKYREHLDLEKRERQSAAQGQKRKAAEDNIAELKKKTKTLLEVCDSLQKDADMFAEQAEGKSGTLMAQLITKSNVLRKRYKDKLSELKKIEAELEIKATELRLT
ncbi:uncharacterized protein LOC121526132 isoform X4 [Cheilinus undulatus]|uniref:uncharacterized protein LOC121526132 isoform X4 n=1 Tax=Cheilinus undulatus TaxID=241271 RepID=UPI001BD3761F|nr:uncharacterized protein LOC121526132 isoform X4 [Cheilinus undulatus]